MEKAVTKTISPVEKAVTNERPHGPESVDMLEEAGIPFYILECDGTSGNEPLEEKFARACVHAFNVFKHKQADYGPGNIAKFGLPGVIVRANDKMERLITLSKKASPDGGYGEKNESIDDTLLDLAVYALIGLLVKFGFWS